MCIRRIVSFYYTFLCCLRGCEDSDEECDDLTSFEGEMPIGARIESMTVVRYVNKDNSIAITHTVVETTHIDPQADCGSGQDMGTKSSIPDDASDASTLVENPETAIVPSASSFQSDEKIIIEKDTEIVLPCPTFVDNYTGCRMVELRYVTSMYLDPIVIPLDDCEFNKCESSESDSVDDEVEALFRYKDLKFCACVPFGYVKARAEMDPAVVD
ncbi:hypothetical protein BDV37DRAFT_282194 [Aspergillus pseudonomiae]|uniref:Uncharacterized protein n=1 Tax=Aspergillus pseudonomiae TaxID=1506151 RepID=A0A5N7DEV2_9EURO|nr:uncharacterized protein BDV37DRAFT_282194 [Aspergillus pseudonomiae]KAE8404951.1 hypothetical protein BDV37DRAFT_282194 [Aspergillus pseudonomiae]